MQTRITEPGATTTLQEQVAYADIYELLALLLQTPTRELFAGLESGKLTSDLAAIFSELGWEDGTAAKIVQTFDALQKDIQEGTCRFGDLRSEHTRLFNHPKKPAVALYEGVFLESDEATCGMPPAASNNREVAKKFQKVLGALDKSSLMFVNRAALDAERCYRQAGLQRTNEMNVPADCMYTEMAFMGYLHAQKAKALMDNDQAAISTINEQLEEFSSLHLQKWAKEFYAKLQEESAHAFYATTGLLGSLLLLHLI